MQNEVANENHLAFTARRVSIARTMLWQDLCLFARPSQAGILSKRLNMS